MPAPAQAATTAPDLPASSGLGKTLIVRWSQTLRVAPNASATAAGTVRAGESLRLLDSTAGWLKVANPRGEIGWISGNDLRISDPDLPYWAKPIYQVTPGYWRASLFPTRAVGSWVQSSPIRASASPTAPILAYAKGGQTLRLLWIPAGEYVPVLTENEVQGWISRYDLMMSSTLPRTEEALLTQVASDRMRLEVRGNIGTFGIVNGAFQVALPATADRRGNLAVKTAGVERLRWEPSGLVVPLTAKLSVTVISQTATNLVVELGPVAVAPPNPDPDPSPAPSLPLSGRTVVLDPGHGGEDPGAIGNGLTEKLLTWDLAQRTKTQLEAGGARVVLTRTGDARCGNETLYTGQTLYERSRTDLACRAAVPGQEKADLYLSIHYNTLPGTTAQGAETYYSFATKPLAESKRFATLIQQSLVAGTGLTDRGVKSDDFYVITYASAPSALVEIGFLSSPTEAAFLNQTATKEKAAAALAKGITAYFE